MKKITNEEREKLKDAILTKLNYIKKYRKETFKLIFNDPIKENMDAWEELDEKGKRKIVQKIYKFFDDSFVTYASSIHGRFRPKMVMKEIKNLKHKQLVEFGIREK